MFSFLYSSTHRAALHQEHSGVEQHSSLEAGLGQPQRRGPQQRGVRGARARRLPPAPHLARPPRAVAHPHAVELAEAHLRQTTFVSSGSSRSGSRDSGGIRSGISSDSGGSSSGSGGSSSGSGGSSSGVVLAVLVV